MLFFLGKFKCPSTTTTPQFINFFVVKEENATDARSLARAQTRFPYWYTHAHARLSNVVWLPKHQPNPNQTLIYYWARKKCAPVTFFYCYISIIFFPLQNIAEAGFACNQYNNIWRACVYESMNAHAWKIVKLRWMCAVKKKEHAFFAMLTTCAPPSRSPSRGHICLATAIAATTTGQKAIGIILGEKEKKITMKKFFYILYPNSIALSRILSLLPIVLSVSIPVSLMHQPTNTHSPLVCVCVCFVHFSARCLIYKYGSE